jgi:hypothetical protein
MTQFRKDWILVACQVCSTPDVILWACHSRSRLPTGTSHLAALVGKMPDHGQGSPPKQTARMAFGRKYGLI